MPEGQRLMDRPTYVYVGPHKYEISFKTSHLRQLEEDLGSQLYAGVNHGQLRIVIGKRSALSQQQDSLLHEVLHAMFTHTGLSNELEDDLEEKLIRRLTPFLLDLVKHNRPVVDFLQVGGEL
jgi:predicted nuclease of restriction endonuclease-like (RecB) superfamily